MKYNLVKVREGKVEDLPNVFNLIKELAKYENALNKIKTNVKTLEKDGYGENPQFKEEGQNLWIFINIAGFAYRLWPDFLPARAWDHQ